MIAFRCRETPTPDKYLDSASASADLTCPRLRTGQARRSIPDLGWSATVVSSPLVPVGHTAAAALRRRPMTLMARTEQMQV